MNTGNSVHEAQPSWTVTPLDIEAAPAGPDDAEVTADSWRARHKPAIQHVQAIQEIIDQLAAVTRKLSRPGGSR